MADHEETTAVSASTARRASGAVLLQAAASVSTVLQMTVFAVVLSRTAFDDYSVWITSSAFLIGLGQAVGVERVMIGKRSFDAGLSSASFLGIGIALAQLGVAVWLQSLPLALCSVATTAYTAWDYMRFARGPEEATWFFKRDLAILSSQLVGVVGAALVGLPSSWLPAVWWGVGLVFWLGFARTVARGVGRGVRLGARVLWADRRESAPLLLDAALAGVPLVLALSLVHAQAAAGEASEARMALTLLGPVTVLGLAARRLVYTQAATSRLDRRGQLVFVGVVVGVFVVCFGLLALTRTPLYGWVLPGFVGLSWLGVLGFATNHGSLMAVVLPAAYLRADARTRAIGLARVLSTLAGLGVIWYLAPLDSAADVAWSVAAGSLAYGAVMYGALVRSGPVV